MNDILSAKSESENVDLKRSTYATPSRGWQFFPAITERPYAAEVGNSTGRIVISGPFDWNGGGGLTKSSASIQGYFLERLAQLSLLTCANETTSNSYSLPCISARTWYDGDNIEGTTSDG